MTYHDLPGWMDWEHGTREIVEGVLRDGDTVVDVGLYLGKSLCCLADNVRRSGKNVRVVGVDWCRGSGIELGRDHHADAINAGGGTLAGLLHRNVIECGLADVVEIIIADSAKAADFFADDSLAWVNIDARHDYESVRRDILAWADKVRRGGWLTGDDYIPGLFPGVVRAVTELLPSATPWAHDSWRWVKE